MLCVSRRPREIEGVCVCGLRCLRGARWSLEVVTTYRVTKNTSFRQSIPTSSCTHSAFLPLARNTPDARRRQNTIYSLYSICDVISSIGVSVYRVGGSWEGSALNRCPFVASVVPQNHLSRVSATHQQVGVELGKACWHDGRLKKGN